MLVPVRKSEDPAGAITVPAVEVSAPRDALSVVRAALMPEKLGKGSFADAGAKLGSGHGDGDGGQYAAGR